MTEQPIDFAALAREIETRVGGAYEFTDGRSFWMDRAAALEIVSRVMPVVQSIATQARQEGLETAANRAREIAEHYPQSSDGRNTFIMLAEWIGARATPSPAPEST